MVSIAVGRFSREKGFDRLKRSFPLVIQEFPDATLTILGDGSDRENLTPACEIVRAGGEGVHARIHGEPIGMVRKSHRLHPLFPLRRDAQPLIEAILHDCPVICARTRGGVEELLGICGLQSALVGESSFERELVAKIKELVRADVVDRVRAREKLERHVAPGKVVREYAMACGSDAQ